MSAIDLSQLPAPEILEALDFEAICTAMKADMVTRYPDCADLLGLESEPLVKLIEVCAYRELILRARYNDEGRAVMLAFATGADLDHIGVTYYQESRLIITPADPAAIPPVATVLETDDAYRQRLVLKPDSWSVAGPAGAYRFHALSASGLVLDAGVTSPTPGTTTVHILSREDGGIPSTTVLYAVQQTLNAETVRPLSEAVIVQAAELINYNIDVGLWIYAGPSSELAHAAALAALQAWADAAFRLGHDIAPSAIIAAAHVAGVQSVQLAAPYSEIAIGPGQAPRCTSISVCIVGVRT